MSARSLCAALVCALLVVPATARAEAGFDYLAKLQKPPGPSSGERTPEILDVTPDGRTLFTTLGERGFSEYDVTDPAHAAFVRTIGVGASSYVTSVNVHPGGKWLVVTVKGRGTDGISRLEVYSLPGLEPVRELPLGAQPDTSMFSPDGSHLVVPIEDENNVQVHGTVEILDTGAADPAAWTKRVATIPDDPALLEPDDVQPEFADISSDGKLAAVTLQENDAVAMIDIASATVTDVWSAGYSTHLADTDGDGEIAFDDPLTERDPLGVPREPDELAFTPDDQHLVLANEGEDGDGGRSFTIHGLDGTVEYDSGNAFEKLLASYGLYDDGRSGSKGSEPEGVDIGVYGGRTYAFIGAERANAVVVADITDPVHPQLLEAIHTGGEPEGLLAAPQRGLVYVVDADAPRGVSILRFADRDRRADDPRPIVRPGATFADTAGLVAPGGRRADVLATGPKTAVLHLDTSPHDGTARTTSATPLDLSLSSGSSFAADPSGGWWAVGYSDFTGERGAWRVSASGAATRVTGIPDGQLYRGVAVSPDGALAYLAYAVQEEGWDLVVLDVAAGTSKTFKRRGGMSLTGLATTPDGDLVAVEQKDYAVPLAPKLVRVPLAGLADGGTLTPEPVADIPVDPRAADSFGSAVSGLGIAPSGEVLVSYPELELIRSLGRLFAPGGADPQIASALPAASTARGIDAQPGDTITQFARSGPRVFATGERPSGAFTVTFGLAAFELATGAPDLRWAHPDEGSVNAIEPDGAGGAFVAGSFGSIGGQPRTNVAHLRADGSVDPAWSATVNGIVYALARSGDTLYLGGEFTGNLLAVSTATGAPRTTPAVDGRVTALTADATGVYLGGAFRNVGGAPHTGLARIKAADGTVDAGWTGALTGSAYLPVSRLVPDGAGRLLVAGTFSRVGGQVRNGLARVSAADGSLDPTLPSLYQSAGTQVRGVAVRGDRLYISASQPLKGSPSRTTLVAIDAANGSPIDAFATGENKQPGPLALIGDRLYAGLVNQLSAYDADTGARITSFEGAIEGGDLNALVTVGGELLVGGEFYRSGLGRTTFAFDIRTGKVAPGWTLGAGEWAIKLAVAGDWLYFQSGVDSRLRRADLGTGAVDPTFSLALGDVALAGDADRLYIAGEFNFVNGVGRRNLVALDARTGDVVTAFKASPDTALDRVWLIGDRLYVRTSDQDDDNRSVFGLQAYEAADGARIAGFAPEIATGSEPKTLTDTVGGPTVSELVTVDSGQSTFSTVLRRLSPATGETLGTPTVLTSQGIDAIVPRGGGLLAAGQFGDGSIGLAAFGPDGAQVDGYAPALGRAGAMIAWGGSVALATDAYQGRAITILDVLAPVAGAAPALTGSVRQDGTAACGTGTFENDPQRFEYRWELDGTPIAGEAGALYTIRETDAGHSLRCVVTASNDAGSAEAATAAVVVAAGAPIVTDAPALSGPGVVGVALSCTPGSWRRSPAAFAYAWLRDGVAIDGADGASYTPAAADTGATLACRVTAENAGGVATAVSASVSVDAAPIPLPKPEPTPGPAPAPAAPRDVTAPRATLANRALTATRDRRSVKLALRCTERCTGTLTLTARGATVGHTTLNLGEGRSTPVTVRLSSRARRLLASGRLKVSATVVVRDAAGNQRRTTFALTLRRGGA